MLLSRTVPPLEARLQENSLKHMTTRTRLRPPEERVSPLQLAVTTALDDMKAVNVRVLDVRELTDVFDTMVIASGNSDRHVRSLAEGARVLRARAPVGRRAGPRRRGRFGRLGHAPAANLAVEARSCACG